MPSQTERLNAIVDNMLDTAIPDNVDYTRDTHKVLLTLDIDVYNRIKARAKREERSVQGQIRYMLKRAENLSS
ncbi:MAG: hypothetical protein VXA34_00965 [Gammaproteobacteria bacterium]